MEGLLYLGKVNVYWILFYVCYWLLFRKHTFFVWNRFYLVGTLIISFFLPLIHFPDHARVAATAVYAVSVVPIYVNRSEAIDTTTHWSQFIWVVQCIGAAIMLLKLAEGFSGLFKLIRQGESVALDEHTLVLLPHNEIGSFSFLKWLVVNRVDYEKHFDAILRHESVHISQLHTLDILLIEFLKVVFWFNPVLWFYKKSMQEVHEYLADEQAPNRDHYANFLVSYALNAPIASLTNHFFNKSMLKNRIRMIYKNRNSQWVLGKYLTIIPIIGIVVMLTAARERLISAVERGSFITRKSEIVVDGKIKDENGNPVKGVSVVQKGGNKGAITDANGAFTIPDLSTDDSLVISHINYDIIVINVQNPALGSLTLHKRDNALDNVVVVGYPKASETTTSDAIQKDRFVAVEQLPEFPGGREQLGRFISSTIQYPSEAATDGIQGEVVVSFTVNEKGYIRNPKVIKGMGAGLDEEALRVVLKMPQWNPGKQGGEAVSVQYNLPITFQLNSAEDRRQGQVSGSTYRSSYTTSFNVPAEVRDVQATTPALRTINFSAANTEPAFTAASITTIPRNKKYVRPATAETIYPKSETSNFGTTEYILDGEKYNEPALLKRLKPDSIQSISVQKTKATQFTGSEKSNKTTISIQTKK